LFGVKSRAKVGDRGGAPVSVIDKLLASVKGLFEPKPAPTVTEHAEPPLPEPPVAAVPEPPPLEAAPAQVVEAPTLFRETPTIGPEPPTVVEESPTVVEQAVAVAEDAPVVEDALVVEEGPAVVDEAVAGTAQPTASVAPAGGLMLRLETERGPRSTFEVTKSGATIGRGPESTIQLADLSVSRKHAKIAFKQGAYWLSDLGSMGGTWVDGTKLAAPRRVAAGQTIDIGLCRLVVVAAAEGEKTGAAKGPSNAA
jgi:FHA domain-containing protein